MTNNEFILWLKGFTEGVHEFNITPKQWDILKEKLAGVSDEERIGTAIGLGGWGTPNGTGGPVFTTTPGTSGHITITSGSHGTVHNVPAVTTSGYISASYIGHPTTTTMPLGTTITYTTSGGPNWYATYFNDLKTDDNDR